MEFLKYIDDEDKAYGITGMVISINIWDDFSTLRAVTLDNKDDEYSVSFNPEFHFTGNPRLSAKITWKEHLRQYQLITGMAMGNMLCRSVVHQHTKLSRQNLDEIYKVLEEEGRETCQLEKDEIDTIFNKTFHYLTNIYANRQLTNLAQRFAKVLCDRRTMTGREVEEQFEILRRY